MFNFSFFFFIAGISTSKNSPEGSTSSGGWTQQTSLSSAQRIRQQEAARGSAWSTSQTVALLAPNEQGPSKIRNNGKKFTFKKDSPMQNIFSQHERNELEKNEKKKERKIRKSKKSLQTFNGILTGCNYPFDYILFHSFFFFFKSKTSIKYSNNFYLITYYILLLFL